MKFWKLLGIDTKKNTKSGIFEILGILETWKKKLNLGFLKLETLETETKKIKSGIFKILETLKMET